MSEIPKEAPGAYGVWERAQRLTKVPAPSPSPVVEVSERMIEAAGKVLLEQVDEYHFPSFDCIRRCIIAALRVR